MKHKRHLSGLDKYVIFSITYTILYSIVVIVLACFGVSVSDVLTEYTYKFFAGEVIVCALIKIFKLAPKSKIVDKLSEIVGFSLNDADDGK